MFLLLASIDWLGQAEIAARLRRNACGIDDAGSLEDAALLSRAIMLLRRPRDLTLAVFGNVPDGLLGAMQRLGHEPAGVADTYQELYRLFASSDPADRRRVKVLGQMSGSLVYAQIRIVNLLDPVLLHPALVSKISDVEQVSELHHALDYVRLRCSGASDDAIRASLTRLGADDHRYTVFQAWAKRFDRLPQTLDTRDDPTLVVLGTAEALINAGRRYSNCLASKVHEAILGVHLYIEYRPERRSEPGVIAELRATSQGYLLEGMHAKGNRRVKADRARVVRSKLAACGVAIYDRAVEDEEMLTDTAKVLNMYRFSEPDNPNWGEEFEGVLEELEAAADAAEAA